MRAEKHSKVCFVKDSDRSVKALFRMANGQGVVRQVYFDRSRCFLPQLRHTHTNGLTSIWPFVRPAIIYLSSQTGPEWHMRHMHHNIYCATSPCHWHPSHHAGAHKTSQTTFTDERNSVKSRNRLGSNLHCFRIPARFHRKWPPFKLRYIPTIYSTFCAQKAFPFLPRCLSQWRAHFSGFGGA